MGWRGCAALIGVLLAVLVRPGVADEKRGTVPLSPILSPKLEPVRFLRAFVPAERVEDWPRRAGRYVPMDAATFDRLAARLSSRSGPSGPRLYGATFWARLEDGPLLEGRASLDVVEVNDAPALVPLGLDGFSLHSAKWDDAMASAAVVGLTRDGALWLLAERAGRVELAWSAPGRHLRDAASVFALDLPKLPGARLDLDLPDGIVPELDHGLAVQQSAKQKGRRTWRFELAGQRPISLRLTPRKGLASQEWLPEVRETLVYDFSQRGVEVTAKLNFDDVGRRREPVRLAIDGPLALVSARWGDEPATWTEQTGEDQSTRHLILEPPDSANGAEELRLVGLAALATDRSWTLPRIQVEGVFWREGEATLVIPEPLRLQQLECVACRQAKAEPIASPRAGQSIQLQYFAPEATARVVLIEPRPTLRIDRGTAFEVGGSAVMASMRAACRVENGSCFELRANLAAGWIIDRIKSTPADAVADWIIRDEPGRPRQLVIRLAKPLAPEEAPVQLTILGRRLQSSVGRLLAIEKLMPLEFDGARIEHDWVSLAAAASYQLVPRESAPGPQENSGDLDPAVGELFDGPPVGLIFARDDRWAKLRVMLRREKPSFTGRIETTALVGAGMLRESHRLRCRPKSPGMDHLLVHLWDNRPEPWRFVLDASEDAPVEARRLSSAEQAAAGLPAQGQTWDVPLVPPRSESFEIRVERSIPLDGPIPLCLAALPEAAKQEARLTIRSADETAPAIENRRLEPIPCEPAAPGRRQTAWAAYRYHPMEADGEPSLVLSTAKSAEGPPGAIVWSVHLYSRFAPHGHARHAGVFRVQNVGRKQIKITLPRGVGHSDVEGVWIGQAPATWTMAEDRKTTAITVDLPTGEATSTITVNFSTSGPALGWGQRLAPAIPTVDVSVLAPRWTVWLPPGYDPIDERCGGAAWTARLFGPLGQGWTNRAGEEAIRRDAGFDPTFLLNRNLNNNTNSEESQTPYAAFDRADTPGWTVCQVDLSDPAEAHVTVAHRDGLEALRWLVLLAVACLLRWDRLKRPAVWIVVGGVAAVGALLLPPVGAVAASGAWLGVLLSFGFGLVPARSSGETSLTKATHNSTVVRPAARLGLLLAVFATMTSVGRAEAPATDASPRDPTPYEVLIPVDANRAPTGDRVYVPEQLLREMNRMEAVRTGRPQGWLWCGAVYRGALAWRTPPNRFVLENLRAEYELRVFGPGQMVRLPLDREQIASSPGGVRLDGRPVEPRWDESSESFGIDVMEPGAYRLEIDVRVDQSSDASGERASPEEGLDWPIPPVAQARLELTLPPHAPTVAVGSARGKIRAGPQRLVADLGGADRLKMSWGGDAVDNGAVEVEELLWLRMAPGSVVTEVQFTYFLSGNPMQEVLLEIEPRLRLFELSPGMEIVPVPGKPHLRRVRFEEPAKDRIVVRASFLATETSGVGNLRLPRLCSRVGRVTRRWLAVSVDPALAYEMVSPRSLKPVAVPDFLKAWGPAAASPLLARNLAHAADAWHIATRPTPPETTVGQMVVVTCGPSAIDVHLRATLQTTPGYGFRYAWTAPPEFEVQRVRVMEDEVDRLSHWSRGADGTIHLALSGPATGARRLLLDGRLPVARRGELDLPIPQLVGGRLRVCQVALLQRPGVSVSLSDVAGLVEAEAPALARREQEAGQLVHSLLNSGAAPPGARLLMEPVEEPDPSKTIVSPVASRAQDGSPRKSVPEKPKSDASGPRVERAEIQIAWRTDGGFSGVARFDLVPAGAAACPLRLPEGCRVLGLWVEGAPARVVPSGRDFEVATASRELPQRIAIVFSAQARRDDADGAWVFPAPELGDFPVNTTVWNSVAPGGRAARSVAEGSRPAMRISHNVLAASRSGGRRPVALLAVGLTLLAYVGLRRGTLARLRERFPAVVGILAGVFWWFFLQPRFVGLLLIVVFLWIAIRGVWHRVRRSRSAVVPLG